MALKKFKQIAQDPVLAKASAAEHGFATFAHLNEIIEYLQNEPSLTPTVVGSLLGQLPVYVDNQAAVDDGLEYGQAYITPTGVVVVLLQ